MNTLQLLQTLEQLQHENFKFFIEWVDIGEEYEYSINVPCSKNNAQYITAVLNEDYKLGVDVEFIPGSKDDLENGTLIIETYAKAIW